MNYMRDQARREEEAQRERQPQERAQRLGIDGNAVEECSINEPGRWGNGKVRITQVELCDGSGREAYSFSSGEPLTVRLHYTAPQLVERPVFGLAVYHETGAHISGPNTQFGGLDIDAVEGCGTVSYRIHCLSLLAGRYRLSVAVVDGSDNEMFDYHDRLYDFQVFPSSNERYGFVTLGGAWQMER
jgi:lipopolysaccharide transport system ATP-binding protein